MKKRNKILALMLAAALAMSMTACGSKDAGSGNAAAETEAAAEAPAEEEIDPFAAAQENMAEVANLDATMLMEMDMEMGAEGQTQTMETDTTMEMTTFTDPLRLKMEMTMDMDAGDAGSMTQNMSIYAETAEDGTCTMYMYDGSSWQAQEVEAADVAQYNASNDMAVYLSDDYGFEAAGTEQVDGADAYKYTGKITGDDMKEVLLSSGALDQFSSLGIDSTQLEGMMDGLGEIPIDLWIDEATLYPVKYEMDMTAVMDALMGNMIEAMGDQAAGMTMSIPKMTISMTCYNYNAATEFEIPAEAKAN